MADRDSAGANMQGAITAFLSALPPERREELRAQVRAAREREAQRRLTDDGDYSQPVDDQRDEEEFGRESHAARPSGGPPLPPMHHAAAAETGELIMLAALREAGRQVQTRAAMASLPQDEAGAASALHDRLPAGHFFRLSDVAPQRLRWLSPGRLAAGKITILDGDPGLGKSTLLCELAARLTTGQALPGGEAAEPRAVVLLSAEDDLHDTIRPRIDAAGGDPRRIVSLVSVPDGTAAARPFVVPDDTPMLEMVVAHVNAALVIVDPFVAFLDRGLSANNDQDVRRALAALKTVAECTGVAIVAVRHLNKSAGTNPLYRGGGSIGIIGAARCGLLLARDPDHEERRILAVTKGNLATPPPSLAFRLETAPGTDVARVVWEGESRWTAAALLAASEEGEANPSTLDAARAWLREALADGPRPAKEVREEAEAMGFGASTLKAAKKAEDVRAWKERRANGQWIWSQASDDTEGVAGGPLRILQPLQPLQLLRLLPLAIAETGDMPAVDADIPGTSDDAQASNVPRQCVDCGTTLPPGRTYRCEHCLARALTDDTD